MRQTIVRLLTFILLIGCSSQATPISDNIELYNAYGNEHQLIVHGRTVIKEKRDEVGKKDSGFSNAWNKIDFFHSDELKNKKIFLTIGNEKFETKGDDEGYFRFNIKTVKKLTMGYKLVNLQIKDNKKIHHAKATIIGSKKLVGIISDIDDTVVFSDVTKKVELFFNTFWKNYKQREVIPTMVKRFKKILSQNPPNKPSRLFFISGSPEQLFTPIEKFLEYNHFPQHITILKHIHGDNKDPLFDQFAYKIDKIENLITLYPKMQWVLFGDSGERDKEVYKFIKKKYPSSIRAYYIRDIDSGKIKKSLL